MWDAWLVSHVAYLFYTNIVYFSVSETNTRPISVRVRSIPGLLAIERNLTEHFLTTRRKETRSINKWGALITKTAIALFLNNQQFFSPSSKEGEEITYELALQLLSKSVQ